MNGFLKLQQSAQLEEQYNNDNNDGIWNNYGIPLKVLCLCNHQLYI